MSMNYILNIKIGLKRKDLEVKQMSVRLKMQEKYAILKTRR